MSARHGELFDTELGLYCLPEHRQMVKASDPAQTWFDIEQRRGYPAVIFSTHSIATSGTPANSRASATTPPRLRRRAGPLYPE